MKPLQALLYISVLIGAHGISWAGVPEKVVTIPTRPGVTQRFICLTPESPRALVILLAGGLGGLQIGPDGTFKWGKGNFLVRTRQLFASLGLTVVVVDAPSDRQDSPFLGGFRQTPEHVADMKAVIAWLKQQAGIPVWLVGTSRGTQSAAFIATQLSPSAGGPDGVILTSTILTDKRSRAVPEMPLGDIKVPVLVGHHKKDGCAACNFDDMPRLMNRLTSAPRKELLTFEGGEDQGDPCEAMSHHGFKGIEPEVVGKISDWIIRKNP